MIFKVKRSWIKRLGFFKSRNIKEPTLIIPNIQVGILAALAGNRIQGFAQKLVLVGGNDDGKGGFSIELFSS